MLDLGGQPTVQHPELPGSVTRFIPCQPVDQIGDILGGPVAADGVNPAHLFAQAVELGLGEAGGGGFGDPMARDAERVRDDVLNELVSREAAERDYGVVIADDGAVDPEATRRRRET